MRQDYFTKNKDEIKSIAKETEFYSLVELRELLTVLKDKQLTSQSMVFGKFYDQLVGIGLLSYSVLINDKYLTRYSFYSNVSDVKLVLSLRKKSFLSMSSSLNYQGLSMYRDSFIFVSQEQSPKESYRKGNLTQEAIDKAFSKDYRRTHKVGEYNNKNIIFLDPKNTQEFAIIEVSGVRVSSINRALVEMVINVQYFRNSKELIRIFGEIKESINIDEVFNVIEHFNLIYPYYQCIGYILEEVGFTKQELIKFKENISNFDFYTDKNQKEYKYISYWKMYV